MLGLATALLLLLSEVVLPRPTDLTAASADMVELERLSTRLGPARLAFLLEQATQKKQPRMALAVLHGIGLMDAAHPDIAMQFLTPLAELLGRLGRGQKLDNKQLAAASEALYRTCGALGHYAACAEDPQANFADCAPPLRDAAERLLALGSESALPMPLREAALFGLAALPLPYWQHLLPQLIKLAKTEPQQPQSHAALAALATLVPRGEVEPLLTLVRTGEPPLSSDAAGELCAVLAPRKGPHPVPVLSDDLATRIRTLAAAEEPIPQRQRLLECLRLLGTPADRALLQAIVTAARKKTK